VPRVRGSRGPALYLLPASHTRLEIIAGVFQVFASLAIVVTVVYAASQARSASELTRFTATQVAQSISTSTLTGSAQASTYPDELIEDLQGEMLARYTSLPSPTPWPQIVDLFGQGIASTRFVLSRELPARPTILTVNVINEGPVNAQNVLIEVSWTSTIEHIEVDSFTPYRYSQSGEGQPRVLIQVDGLHVGGTAAATITFAAGPGPAKLHLVEIPFSGESVSAFLDTDTDTPQRLRFFIETPQSWLDYETMRVEVESEQSSHFPVEVTSTDPVAPLPSEGFQGVPLTPVPWDEFFLLP